MAERFDDANIIVGRNAVLELIRSDGGAEKLLVQRELLTQRQESVPGAIISEAKKRGVPVASVDKKKLDFIAGHIPHQGFAAYVALIPEASTEDVFSAAEAKNETPFMVICDGINDPHNLGAVMRTAELCGAHGILVPKRGGAVLSATVVKASAGASSYLNTVRVSNIASTVEELKHRGVWVYAVEAGGTPYYELDLSGPCAFVLGGEGSGVSRLVKERCDFTVSIPMYGRINSYNVSAAAAVILTEAARQRHVRE